MKSNHFPGTSPTCFLLVGQLHSIKFPEGALDLEKVVHFALKHFDEVL